MGSEDLKEPFQYQANVETRIPLRGCEHGARTSSQFSQTRRSGWTRPEQFGWNGLPEDVFVLLLDEYLDFDPPTVKALAQTCRAYASFCRPHLLRLVHVNGELYDKTVRKSRTRIEQFKHDLKRHPSLRNAIRTLCITNTNRRMALQTAQTRPSLTKAGESLLFVLSQHFPNLRVFELPLLDVAGKADQQWAVLSAKLQDAICAFLKRHALERLSFTSHYPLAIAQHCPTVKAMEYRIYDPAPPLQAVNGALLAVHRPQDADPIVLKELVIQDPVNSTAVIARQLVQQASLIDLSRVEKLTYYGDNQPGSQLPFLLKHCSSTLSSLNIYVSDNVKVATLDLHALGELKHLTLSIDRTRQGRYALSWTTDTIKVLFNSTNSLPPLQSLEIVVRVSASSAQTGVLEMNYGWIVLAGNLRDAWTKDTRMWNLNTLKIVICVNGRDFGGLPHQSILDDLKKIVVPILKFNDSVVVDLNLVEDRSVEVRVADAITCRGPNWARSNRIVPQFEESVSVSGAVRTNSPLATTIVHPQLPQSQFSSIMSSLLTPEHPGLDEDRIYVKENIIKHMRPLQSKAIAELYSSKALSRTIDKFLQETDLYDSESHRWVDLPPSTSMTRDQVRAAILKILTAIQQEVGTKSHRKERHIVDTHDMLLAHSEIHDRRGNVVHSSPDIVVTGEVRDGRSFEMPDEGSAGFENALLCIEIRTALDRKKWNLWDMIALMGAYARQILILQPNRLYVRMIWFTEETISLFHFDRAGVQFRDFISFHRNPRTLIQLFLGITGLNEQKIGFDSSIKFTFSNGKKIGGRVYTHDGRKMTWYKMVSPEPVYQTSEVRGRGVVCWRVLDGRRKRELIVKDSWEWRWEGPDMPSEFEHLKKAAGLTGVVQLVAAEDKRNCIHDFRPPSFTLTNVEVELEVTYQWRVVVEAYGKDISFFTSEAQLFGAMRDAIAAHKSLVMSVDCALLHRDVSRGNILLGDQCAEPGWRGILIDLDKAWNVHDIPTSEITHYGVGTRCYQSISVLRGYENDRNRRVGWHDTLDDLESFFYVLFEIMQEKKLSFEGNEWTYEIKDERSDLIKKWHSNDTDKALRSKLKFLDADELDLDSLGFGNFWSPSARTLLKSFFQWVRKILQLKLSHSEIEDDDEAIDAHYALCDRDQLKRYYAEVLSPFDTALAGASERPMPAMKPSPKDPSRQPFLSAKMNMRGWLAAKRGREEDGDLGASTAKRARKREDVYE
ncbi:hypothetical protein NMY22_g14519 [Coprinellus aureogranulatus]|nr:hypothetical protein NMY22_g14519 [Coprinellus aureogranulatus]